MVSLGCGLGKADGIDRVIPAEDTLRTMLPLAKQLGMTRLADITGLDRIGIPVYSSVVPRSDDCLSVYSGKGARPVDARAGAMMEAIERQTALRARLPTIEGSYSLLSRDRNVLHPSRVKHELAPDYSDERTYSWVEGLDMISGRACWVPAKLAGFRWDVPHASPYGMNDTSGIASGNCREEAICHALCELAERDAWTMADIAMHQMPRLRRALLDGPDAGDGPDDLEFFPCLDLGSHELVQKFHAAGLYPVVRDITSCLGIPAIFASVADDHLAGFPMAHSGLGAHPNANVAVRRALTELAQSRCVDIQGVREDLLPPDESAEQFSLHRRRVSAIHRESWYLGPSVHRRRLSELSSFAAETIDEDLRFLLDRFVASGLDQIILVDFTPSAQDYSVVRVIVPGIEFWASDQGTIGARALAFWKEHV